MSMSLFTIQNPTSFGFDTPGLASARPRYAGDNSAAEREADLASQTTPLSPAPAPARSIDPMLLVYQERVETFRVVARFVRRAFAALTGRRPASRETADRMTRTLATN